MEMHSFSTIMIWVLNSSAVVSLAKDCGKSITWEPLLLGTATSNFRPQDSWPTPGRGVTAEGESHRINFRTRVCHGSHQEDTCHWTKSSIKLWSILLCNSGWCCSISCQNSRWLCLSVVCVFDLCFWFVCKRQYTSFTQNACSNTSSSMTVHSSGCDTWSRCCEGQICWRTLPDCATIWNFRPRCQSLLVQRRNSILPKNGNSIQLNSTQLYSNRNSC